MASTHSHGRGVGRVARLTGAATTGALLSLTIAGVAGAAPSHHHAVRPHHTHAARHHFTINGLVASDSSGQLSVVANVLRVGASTQHGVVVTLPAPRHAGLGHTVAAGDRIVASGWTATDSSGATTYDVQSDSVTPAPSTVLVGTVQSVDPTTGLLSVTPFVPGSTDQSGTSGDGQGEDNGGTVTVDASSATSTLDGVSGSPVAGDVVVVVGEVQHDAVLAADVFGFSQAPAFEAGDISSISGTVVTLDSGDASTSVDLSGVPVMLDGVAGDTVANLVAGDSALVIGTTASDGTFTPSQVIAFSPQDDEPAVPSGD